MMMVMESWSKDHFVRNFLGKPVKNILFNFLNPLSKSTWEKLEFVNLSVWISTYNSETVYNILFV